MFLPGPDPIPHRFADPDPGVQFCSILRVFIVEMQTISFLLFRLQESGLSSQDILSEKSWKKRYAGIIFTSGEKGNICFFLC